MTKNLINQFLFRAVATKRPERDCPYCSDEYRALLEKFGMLASLSRKRNCDDNAPMERFWGTLKRNLVHHQRFTTRQEAMQEIRENF